MSGPRPPDGIRLKSIAGYRARLAPFASLAPHHVASHVVAAAEADFTLFFIRRLVHVLGARALLERPVRGGLEDLYLHAGLFEREQQAKNCLADTLDCSAGLMRE